jgi:hypothetical protein
MTKNKKVGYVTIYDLQGRPVRFLESVDIPYYLGKGFTKTPPKQPKTPATAPEATGSQEPPADAKGVAFGDKPRGRGRPPKAK